MPTQFWKMHGLGNDFVILSGDGGVPARAIADRRHGIGCDQVIVLRPDNRVIFFNADGSRAGACGNGTRCVADLLMRQTGHDAVAIHTDAGIVRARRDAAGVRVDMGPIRTAWHEVPLAAACDTLHVPMAHGALTDGVACSLGNPHVTFFVPDADRAEMSDAACLEHDPMLPERGNIGVVSVSDGRLRARIWERGAGLTHACGTGACAAAVAAMRRDLCGRSVTVLLDGGMLDVTWAENGHVVQAGPVACVYEGTIDLAALPRPARAPGSGAIGSTAA